MRPLLQRSARVTYLCILPALALAAAESPYAGAAACAPCHPAQSRKQAGSHHALALRRATDTLLARVLPKQPIRERNGTSFEYRITARGFEAEASQGSTTAMGLLEWVFGAGALALTPVGRDAQGYFEHRVSWYTASQAPGMTLGHSPQKPQTPAAALGRRTKADEITRCFGCHAAGVKPGPDLEWLQSGVQCERCHGPGRTHVRTQAKTDISVNRAADAKSQVAFCAQCHRAPVEELGGAPEQADPMLVRFAPVGLVASRCFRASSRLTCLTCHDPHEKARQDAAFYSAKCQTCHEQRKPASACAFTTSDCLSCHMQKKTPVKDLTFTDHRIRVY